MKKRLFRSETDRRLGGVCGGLAEYLDFDVSIIRIAFCVAGLFGGFGIVLYLIMWLVVPNKSQL